MNRFDIKTSHRLGIKTKSVCKLHQAEILNKEYLDLHEIYKNEKSELPITEIELQYKPLKIDILNNIPRVNTEPKMRKVVLNAYQKFLKKDFKLG